MTNPALSSQDTHIVLYSSSHVMFLKMNQLRLAETFKNRDVNFKNGSIEPIQNLPSDVQIGRVYRHYAPAEVEVLA
jgi:hypothetical protein